MAEPRPGTDKLSPCNESVADKVLLTTWPQMSVGWPRVTGFTGSTLRRHWASYRDGKTNAEIPELQQSPGTQEQAMI